MNNKEKDNYSNATLDLIKKFVDSNQRKRINSLTQIESEVENIFNLGPSLFDIFDREGDDLSFIINGLPKNGTLKNNNTNITENDLPKNIVGSEVIYSSTSDSATVDSFTFRTNDGISLSFSAKVSHHH